MSRKAMVTIVLIACLIVSCSCNPFEKFTRERDAKLNTVFYSFKALSPIKCCYRCHEHSSCTAVNYSPDFKICELNNGSAKSDSQQHEVYYKNYPCEDQWVLFGSHCYRLISTMTDWQKSEAQCNELNGHLVDIQSEDENTFVRKMADSGELPGQKVWIGMYIEDGGRQRSWTVGSLVAYQNFATGEPGSHENCVEMLRQKKWNDSICEHLKISICKKPAP